MQNYTLFTGWRVLSQTFMSQVKCNVWLAICMHIEHIFHHTYHKYFDIVFRYFFGYSFEEAKPHFHIQSGNEKSKKLWTPFEQNLKRFEKLPCSSLHFQVGRVSFKDGNANKMHVSRVTCKMFVCLKPLWTSSSLSFFFLKFKFGKF